MSYQMFFVLFVLLSICVYFLPSITAYFKGPSSFASIFIVNTFLGWTLLGWVLSLAWAFQKNNQKEVVHVVYNKDKEKSSLRT